MATLAPKVRHIRITYLLCSTSLGLHLESKVHSAGSQWIDPVIWPRGRQRYATSEVMTYSIINIICIIALTLHLEILSKRVGRASGSERSTYSIITIIQYTCIIALTLHLVIKINKINFS